MSESTNPQVSVDAGDLLELQQAATAWAGALRERAAERSLGALPAGSEDVRRYQAAADRIDAAVSRASSDLTAGLTGPPVEEILGMPLDRTGLTIWIARQVLGHAYPDKTYEELSDDEIEVVARNLKHADEAMADVMPIIVVSSNG